MTTGSYIQISTDTRMSTEQQPYVISCSCSVIQMILSLFSVDHLLELTLLLSSNLPSLRALDLCDNHISDLRKVTILVTTAASIRSINLSGNPAFVS